MTLQRGLDGADPVRQGPVGRLAGQQEERRVGRSWLVATGTLACPRCDAPVALPDGGRSPADPLGCPFCRHTGALRDFLSLAAPSRPARVEVRVIPPPDRTPG
jgi:hypothetical protein